MIKHAAFVSASAALLILLSGCASIPPAAESAESRNKTIASCGIMGKLLNGEVQINASTVGEVEKTLKTLAEDGPGEVKTTARFVLDGMEGRDHSNTESDKQIEKFKSYCMNYTVD